jgi:transposase
MGAVQAFGIEGTGSYGAGLSRFLRERGHTVVEVNRPNRQLALRPGPLTSTLASAKASLRAIARRWMLLDAEIKQHDAHLETLTAARTPELLKAHGMASGTAAEAVRAGPPQEARVGLACPGPDTSAPPARKKPTSPRS